MLIHYVLLATVLSASTQAREGPPFPRIANCYGVWLTPTSTPQDIEEIARFDLLIGGVWADWNNAEQREKLAANIAAIRARNPHIIILDFSSSVPYTEPENATFPADGWLLQPDGSRIDGWPGTQMINLTRPEVIEWLAQRSVASVRDKGFDGTFIDCMGSGFDWWACNIASGEPYEVDADGDGQADERDWLNRTWVEAKTELSRRVRAALGDGVPFMTNQAGDWGLPYMNGILLEDYLDYVLDGRVGWDAVLDDYLRWTGAPHRPNVTTIVSSSGLEPPFNPWQSMTEQERQALLERGRGLLQRMRFGLATTLMGDGYFAYDLHTRWRGQRWWYPEYDAPLGYPKGPAARQPDGSWRREFDGGTAIVNPTHLDVVVELPGRHRDVSSGKVATRFIIPSQDGRILLPTTEPETAGMIPDPEPLFTLTGPEKVLADGDRILVRLKGGAALFDACGRLLEIADRQHTLVQNVRPFVVRDDRWRDFNYEGCESGATGDGAIFTGQRTDGEMRLAYEQEVRSTGNTLTILYRWRALTDAHLHMNRHQADFPVAVYGGGSFRVDGDRHVLPPQRAPQPALAEQLRRVDLVTDQGSRITVETSINSTLVDERHYGVAAYRLGMSPKTGDVKADEQWECRWRFRIEP